MKNKALIALTIVIAGVTILFAKPEKDAPQFDLNNYASADLNERMTRLEEKVSKLQEENYQLKASIDKIKLGAIVPKEDWKKKEINGETFYVIPIAGE